jgi:hypothetical protein
MTPESPRDPQDLLGSAGCFALETASESVSSKEPKKKPYKTNPWDQPRTFSHVDPSFTTSREHTSTSLQHGSLPTPPTPSRQLINTQMDVGCDLDSQGCAYASENHDDVPLTTRCVVCISSSSGFLNMLCKALISIRKQVCRCWTLSFPHSPHAPILLLILPPQNSPGPMRHYFQAIRTCITILIHPCGLACEFESSHDNL